MPELEIIPNNKDRLFEAYASAEVMDSQGDIIPIDELKRVMPVYMKRGGALQFQHSNKPVGKVINYSFVTKNTPAGDIPALKITGLVFNDYPTDNQVWEGIKNGQLQGISFGGNGRKLGKYKVGDDEAVLLSELEPFEFSIVDKPANPEATFSSVSFAKSGENQPQNNEVEVMVKKKEEQPREEEDKKEDEEDEEETKSRVELAARVSGIEKKLAELTEYISSASKKAEEEEDEEEEKKKEGDGEEVKLPLPDDQKDEAPHEGDVGTPETDSENFEEKVRKAVATEIKKAFAGFKITTSPRASVETKKEVKKSVPNPVDIAMGKTAFGVEELVKFDRAREELERV